MRKIRFIIIPLVIFFLSGCLNLDTEITIEPDGSGTLRLEYRISRMIADLRKTGNETGPIPLPVEEEDFRNAVQTVSGISLDGYSRAEDEDQITISASLNFDSIEALNTFYSMSGNQTVTLLGEGDSVVFTLAVYNGADEPLDEETAALIDSFFSDYYISFKINTPSPVISVTPGSIGESENQAVFSESVAALIKKGEAVDWTVSW
ncbi:MAG: hypothetical protein ACLFST_07210 [Spirochaetia bacterium]